MKVSCGCKRRRVVKEGAVTVHRRVVKGVGVSMK